MSARAGPAGVHEAEPEPEPDGRGGKRRLRNEGLTCTTFLNLLILLPSFLSGLATSYSLSKFNSARCSESQMTTR